MRPEDIHLTCGLKNVLPTLLSFVPEKFWPFPTEANWRTNGSRHTFLRSHRAPQVPAADIVKMRNDFWACLRVPSCRCHSYRFCIKFRFHVFAFFLVSRGVTLHTWKTEKSPEVHILTHCLQRPGTSKKGYLNSHLGGGVEGGFISDINHAILAWWTLMSFYCFRNEMLQNVLFLSCVSITVFRNIKAIFLFLILQVYV